MNDLDKKIFKYWKKIEKDCKFFSDMYVMVSSPIRDAFLTYSDVIDITKHGKKLRGLHTGTENFDNLVSTNHLFDNPEKINSTWINHKGFAIDDHNYSSGYILSNPKTLEILKKFHTECPRKATFHQMVKAKRSIRRKALKPRKRSTRRKASKSRKKKGVN